MDHPHPVALAALVLIATLLGAMLALRRIAR